MRQDDRATGLSIKFQLFSAAASATGDNSSWCTLELKDAAHQHRMSSRNHGAAAHSFANYSLPQLDAAESPSPNALNGCKKRARLVKNTANPIIHCSHTVYFHQICLAGQCFWGVQDITVFLSTCTVL